jgi:hypothetical protein
VVQDLVRSYVVFIDGERRGRLRQFQTQEFALSLGVHSVRLAMPDTGRATSDEIRVILNQGEIRSFVTKSRGYQGYMPTMREVLRKFPAIFFPEAMYRGPWIRLELQDSE